jgi:hypothetical protein
LPTNVEKLRELTHNTRTGNLNDLRNLTHGTRTATGQQTQKGQNPIQTLQLTNPATQTYVQNQQNQSQSQANSANPSSTSDTSTFPPLTPVQNITETAGLSFGQTLLLLGAVIVGIIVVMLMVRKK